MDSIDKVIAGAFLAGAVLLTWLITYQHGEEKVCSALGGTYVSGACLDVSIIKLEK